MQTVISAILPMLPKELIVYQVYLAFILRWKWVTSTVTVQKYAPRVLTQFNNENLHNVVSSIQLFTKNRDQIEIRPVPSELGQVCHICKLIARVTNGSLRPELWPLSISRWWLAVPFGSDDRKNKVRRIFTGAFRRQLGHICIFTLSYFWLT